MEHSHNGDNFNILIRQYIAISTAHRWMIALIVALALTIGVVSTVTSPDEYTTTTTVNFDLKNSGNPFARSGAVDGSFIATQVDLIASKTVAQRVVDNLSEENYERVKLSIWNDYTLTDTALSWMRRKVEPLLEMFSKEEVIESGEVSAENGSKPVEYSWMVGSILARLTVTPIIGSSNVELSYVSIDPKVAALIVNEIASEFRKYSIERGTKPAERTSAWLDEQIATLRGRLEDAQTKLTKFQQENEVIASDDRLDVEQVKLQQLTTQLGDQQQQTKELESRWQQIKASEGDSLSTIPQIINDPSIRNIKAELRELERQLTEVSSKFGENHPQYKSVVAELRNVRGKFSREVRSIAESAEKEAKLAKKTEETLAKALQDQKTLVLKLKDQKDMISVLEREVESQRETYNAALDQYNQSNLRSLVSQANVDVVDFAAPPKNPSGPSLVTNIIVSIFLGLVLAIGIVFLKEFFNRKIRCKEDVFITDETRLLGVIG